MTITVTAVGQIDGEVLFVDTEEGVWKDPTTAIPVATNAAAGLMAAAEHTKLAGIEAGAVAAGAIGDAFSTSHLSAFAHGVIATALQPGDVDDAPVNGATTAPVSSNWAYDHVAASDPHPGYVLESTLGSLVQVADIDDSPVNGATAAPISSNWAYDLEASLVNYAPVAKGVTNGDSHDHSGGDGATIAYSTLSGIPSSYTPAAHTSSHASGGGDSIKLDDLASPDNNTDLNASTTAHGLMHVATAPSAGNLNVSGIANGETGHSEKTIFVGVLQIRVLSESEYAALSPPVSTTLYFTTADA